MTGTPATTNPTREASLGHHFISTAALNNNSSTSCCSQPGSQLLMGHATPRTANRSTLSTKTLPDVMATLVLAAQAVQRHCHIPSSKTTAAIAGMGPGAGSHSGSLHASGSHGWTAQATTALLDQAMAAVRQGSFAMRHGSAMHGMVRRQVSSSSSQAFLASGSRGTSFSAGQSSHCSNLHRGLASGFTNNAQSADHAHGMHEASSGPSFLLTTCPAHIGPPATHEWGAPQGAPTPPCLAPPAVMARGVKQSSVIDSGSVLDAPHLWQAGAQLLPSYRMNQRVMRGAAVSGPHALRPACSTVKELPSSQLVGSLGLACSREGA